MLETKGAVISGLVGCLVVVGGPDELDAEERPRAIVPTPRCKLTPVFNGSGKFVHMRLSWHAQVAAGVVLWVETRDTFS